MITQQADLAAFFMRLSQQQGVPPAALLAIAAPLMKEAAQRPLDAIERLLRRKASDFKALRRRLQQQPLADAEIARLRQAAAAALETGQFADADRALAEAELHIFGALTDLSQLVPERRVAAAACRADRGTVSLLRLCPQSYREAAQRFGEAAAIIGLVDLGRSRDVSASQAEALARLGEDFSDASGYGEAIEHYQRLLAGLDNFQDTLAWAQMQDRLGCALAGLARLKSDSARLHEAASCYRTALEDLRQQDEPALWLRLQQRLGRIALELGEAENSAELLEESVQALRAVQKHSRPAEAPEDCAGLHLDLGDALSALGRRTSGTARLEDAMNAYRCASEIWTREARPRDWATVQDRIGLALSAMGERYTEPLILEEALAVFTAALELRRREEEPQLWATTLANRGQAALQLAERRRDPALAEQALSQLISAIEALQAAGEPAGARRLEAPLLKAGALVTALRGA